MVGEEQGSRPVGHPGQQDAQASGMPRAAWPQGVCPGLSSVGVQLPRG